MTLRELIAHMGPVAIAVVVVMLAMSAWSIAVMIDRWIAYSASRKQSRLFAPAIAGALREGHLEEAVAIASRYKRSHLAKVLVAGLLEFRAHGADNAVQISGKQIDASKRALDRARAIVDAELERGLGTLATIGSTGPFVGLFGTVVGIIDAFESIKVLEAPGIKAVAGGISEALITTAIGLFVAIPAVWMYNYFTMRVKTFGIEMENSSSELIDYFLKQHDAAC